MLPLATMLMLRCTAALVPRALPRVSTHLLSTQTDGVTGCVESNLRRVRPESPRRPPRHRRDACSIAWRCRFLTARRSQRGHVVAEK